MPAATKIIKHYRLLGTSLAGNQKFYEIKLDARNKIHIRHGRTGSDSKWRTESGGISKFMRLVHRKTNQYNYNITERIVDKLNTKPLPRAKSVKRSSSIASTQSTKKKTKTNRAKAILEEA